MTDSEWVRRVQSGFDLYFIAHGLPVTPEAFIGLLEHLHTWPPAIALKWAEQQSNFSLRWISPPSDPEVARSN